MRNGSELYGQRGWFDLFDIGNDHTEGRRQWGPGQPQRNSWSPFSGGRFFRKLQFHRTPQWQFRCDTNKLERNVQSDEPECYDQWQECNRSEFRCRERPLLRRLSGYESELGLGGRRRVQITFNSDLECYRSAKYVTFALRGYLTITTLVQNQTCGDADHSASSWKYTSGMIQWNSLNFTYGTIEFSAKMPGGQGTGPAISWMPGYSSQASNVQNQAGRRSLLQLKPAPGFRRNRHNRDSEQQPHLGESRDPFQRP